MENEIFVKDIIYGIIKNTKYLRINLSKALHSSYIENLKKAMCHGPLPPPLIYFFQKAHKNCFWKSIAEHTNVLNRLKHNESQFYNIFSL